ADNPDAFALLAAGRRPLTYVRLYDEILEQARLLRAIGIGKEDRVALLLPNGPEAALSFLSTSAISACAPLNPIFMQYALDASHSLIKHKLLYSSPDLDVEKRALAGKRGIRIVTAAPALDREAGLFTLSVAETARRGSDVMPEPDDLALILHTSGTTSRPK